MKCTYCGKPLPEPEGTHYLVSDGYMGKGKPACLACVKTKKLTVTGIERIAPH